MHYYAVDQILGYPEYPKKTPKLLKMFCKSVVQGSNSSDIPTQVDAGPFHYPYAAKILVMNDYRVVKFRRTGESSRSDEDAISGEHEIQIEGVRTELEAIELEDGAAVPKEFANPTDDTFMVEDAVEAIGFGKFQWKLSVLTGLAWARLEGTIWILYSKTLLQGLKISVFWTLYYGILSGFAPVYSWILVLRGLVGFGIGGVPQSVTLYAEFLPMKARAKCILLIEVFWAIGTVFEVLLAVFVMPTLGWRWLLILSAVPLLLFAILCFWLPESARYDVLSGNQEKAIATLKRIAAENGAPMPLGKLIISRQEDRGKMRDLFTPQFRWTTLLLWLIWFSNAFSYYGLVLLTTELFQAGDVCSISSRRKAVKAKCSLACEYLTEEDYTDLLWTTLSEFPGVLVTLWIIDRIGRKKTMALSFFVFSFCSLLLFLCVGRNVLTVLLFIARAFISGGFQAAYVYTPENPSEDPGSFHGTSPVDGESETTMAIVVYHLKETEMWMWKRPGN
ncbi:Synaptic vesicle 2-related protein [Chelonia mydas]|uniref:Synaptic vesicle 2-related protein n=1 Tax=Chelonia mydas TaxID=8469 RepID=M7C975_CHEMY|nr:Synaptic vesicle 2-related protein [Chelonia mydas]